MKQTKPSHPPHDHDHHHDHHHHGEDDTCELCGLVPIAETVRHATQVVCESPAMRSLLRRAGRFAASDAPVMVLGESGSGKEVVARVLHRSSPRSNRPFVAVNVAALPTELLESELFGHARGAFTGANRAKAGLFEAANGGSLFLDEIGDMPSALQVKLLRALQDGEIRRVGDTKPFAVDVRVICATHRDLTDLVESGRFRQDLLYRLKVLTLQVPPLRQRRPDIMPLAGQFLRAERTAARDFSEEAEHRLVEYPWPGNVRELENAVRHGAALATGPQMEAKHLPEEIRRPGASCRSDLGSSPALRPLAEVEREHILAVLDACDGAVGSAARILGIARSTLWRKLKRYE